MNLNGNASNNTIFADKKGNIAYWHGNFMPKRDPKFDWEEPVDGASPDTEWHGMHSVDEIVQVFNPTEGWIQNCNATPFTVSGKSSPQASQYPRYMAPDAENYRGINAVRVLSSKKIFTLDTLVEVARDPYLAGFEKLIPSLIADFENVKSSASEAQKDAIEVLKKWDFRCGVNSVPTTLAIYWGEKIQKLARGKVASNQKLDFLSFTDFIIAQTTPQEKVKVLQEALDELTRDFGKWQLPWGEVNRFQRLTGKIEESYDDAQPSIGVGFTPSTWGSLAAYGARRQANTKKRYGNVGNSFVAVVEFGPKVRARSVTTGGTASRPASVHFTDQAPIYTTAQFKDVWFYPEEVRKHLERDYKP
jgi:acyl-homoserine-lactone acylase